MIIYLRRSKDDSLGLFFKNLKGHTFNLGEELENKHKRDPFNSGAGGHNFPRIPSDLKL